MATPIIAVIEKERLAAQQLVATANAHRFQLPLMTRARTLNDMSSQALDGFVQEINYN